MSSEATSIDDSQPASDSAAAIAKAATPGHQQEEMPFAVVQVGGREIHLPGGGLADRVRGQP